MKAIYATLGISCREELVPLVSPRPR
jgi:hypothetical protein